MTRIKNEDCPKCKGGKLKKHYIPPNDGWPNGQKFLPGGALTGSRWIYKCDACDYQKNNKGGHNERKTAENKR